MYIFDTSSKSAIKNQGHIGLVENVHETSKITLKYNRIFQRGFKTVHNTVYPSIFTVAQIRRVNIIIILFTFNASKVYLYINIKCTVKNLL